MTCAVSTKCFVTHVWLLNARSTSDGCSAPSRLCARLEEVGTVLTTEPFLSPAVSIIIIIIIIIIIAKLYLLYAGYLHLYT